MIGSPPAPPLWLALGDALDGELLGDGFRLVDGDADGERDADAEADADDGWPDGLADLDGFELDADGDGLAELDADGPVDAEADADGWLEPLGPLASANAVPAPMAPTATAAAETASRRCTSFMVVLP